MTNPDVRTIVITIGGSFASSTSDNDGFEWFCEDYIYGTDEAARTLCISSYAIWPNITSTLADNISALYHQVHEQIGQRPKLVLVGKSMGGCKLHRAIEEHLHDDEITVDLFVGIDSV